MIHAESGQIKIMVADWSQYKLKNVEYHWVIQSTLDYTIKHSNGITIPYNVNTFVNLCISSVDDIFNWNVIDRSRLKELVSEMYLTELDELNTILNSKPKYPTNWAYLTKSQ